MRRIYQLPEFRRLNQLHALKSMKRRLLAKERRRKQNRSLQGVPKSAGTRLLHIEAQGYSLLVAPSNFSFLENPEGVISYIAKLDNHFKNNNKVFVVLKNVTQFDYAAIVVLLAIMVRFKSHDIPFNGDIPTSRSARSLLVRSGFFSNLGKTYDIAARYHITEDTNHRIHTHAWKKVDAKLGDEIITQASQMLWGEKRRCPGVQTALIELMQNTNNHAVIGQQGEKHWWLSVYHPKNENKVCFSFVDFGVGIFNSLENKPSNSKFHNWRDKMATRFQYGNNAELLRLILAGELHKTVTDLPYRGKGLPGIAELTRTRDLSELHIVTNNVFCSYSKSIFRTLQNSFSGTLVTWSLTLQNGSLAYD